jgi:restriction system protein
MITTSQFSKDAKDFVALIEKKIILIEGAQLAEYMIENNVGVAEKSKLFGKEIGP